MLINYKEAWSWCKLLNLLNLWNLLLTECKSNVWSWLWLWSDLKKRRIKLWIHFNYKSRNSVMWYVRHIFFCMTIIIYRCAWHIFYAARLKVCTYLSMDISWYWLLATCGMLVFFIENIVYAMGCEWRRLYLLQFCRCWRQHHFTCLV